MIDDCKQPNHNHNHHHHHDGKSLLGNHPDKFFFLFIMFSMLNPMMVHAINVYSVYPIDEKRTFDDTIDIDDDIGRKKMKYIEKKK